MDYQEEGVVPPIAEDCRGMRYAGVGEFLIAIELWCNLVGTLGRKRSCYY